MHYTYNTAYSANQAYTVPVGVPPHIAQKMMTASNAFRYFDKDHTGTLNQSGMYFFKYTFYIYALIIVFICLFNYLFNKLNFFNYSIIIKYN